MKLACRNWLLAVIGLVLLAGRSEAQSELTGRVLGDDGKPIAGASITLTSIRYTVRTDSLGRFRLSDQPGSTLSFSLKANGFRDDTAAVVLQRGRPVVKDFRLVSRSAVPEANPSDRLIRGRVFTVEGEPIGYVNIQVNSSTRIVADDSGRFSAPVTGVGSLTIIGRRIGFPPRVRISPWIRSGQLVNEEINTLITPTSLSGVEVYSRSSTVPLEFSMVEGTCGVVVFWTK